MEENFDFKSELPSFDDVGLSKQDFADFDFDIDI